MECGSSRCLFCDCEIFANARWELYSGSTGHHQSCGNLIRNIRRVILHPSPILHPPLCPRITDWENWGDKCSVWCWNIKLYGTGQWPVPVFMNLYLRLKLFFVRNIKLLFYIKVTSALEVLKGETGRLNWSLENWGSLTWHFSRVQYSVKVFRLSENPREVSGLRYDHMMVSSSTHQFMGIKKPRQRIILPPVTTQCLLDLHSIISY